MPVCAGRLFALSHGSIRVGLFCQDCSTTQMREAAARPCKCIERRKLRFKPDGFRDIERARNCSTNRTTCVQPGQSSHCSNSGMRANKDFNQERRGITMPYTQTLPKRPEPKAFDSGPWWRRARTQILTLLSNQMVLIDLLSPIADKLPTWGHFQILYFCSGRPC